jgi:thioredoxin-related protein
MAAGTRIVLPTEDWRLHKQTLLLVLSTQCKYCTASAPFYRRLAAEAADKTDLVVIAAQSPNETREYLHRLGVSVHDVRQILPDSIEINATPSLVLIDSQGIVIRS